MKVSLLFLTAFLSSSAAYNNAKGSVNRRQAFGSLATIVGGVAFVGPETVNAIDACPPKSVNCIRTTWSPPSGVDKAGAIASLKKALESYPQEGQDKVDLGGWAFVEDNLSSSGSARIEFTSGIGNFARFLNGGKPFIDDLKLEVADSGVVEVKSASRIGESDFGVNQKRLKFLASKLRADGWTAPEPAY